MWRWKVTPVMGLPPHAQLRAVHVLLRSWKEVPWAPSEGRMGDGGQGQHAGQCQELRSSPSASKPSSPAPAPIQCRLWCLLCAWHGAHPCCTVTFPPCPGFAGVTLAMPFLGSKPRFPYLCREGLPWGCPTSPHSPNILDFHLRSQAGLVGSPRAGANLGATALFWGD